MLVADLMTTDVITLNEGDNLDLARIEMDLARIRHLPVVRQGRLVGLVTHRDLLTAMCSVFAGLEGRVQEEILREVPVLEIMSRDVQSVSPELDAADAGQLMLDNKFGCLPVVAEGDLLVGIVTEADFVDLTLQYLRLRQKLSEEEDERSAEELPDIDEDDERW